ncbi:MAG: hypothetical protein WAK00_13165 [Microbacterium sp.]|uniref:hypothetical protein n=1 Tax=Microbacterium sp. TaxID=51671 RepID=UPI003BB0C4AC
MKDTLWTVVAGIAALVGLAFTVIFFLATQEVGGRDLIVVSLGLVTGAAIAAFVALFIFYSDARKKRLSAAPLKSRLEALREKRAELHDARSALENARGMVQVYEAQAVEALEDMGWPAQAKAHRATAKQWKISVAHYTEDIGVLEAEVRRLDSLTEDEYLREQKRVRGY